MNNINDTISQYDYNNRYFIPAIYTKIYNYINKIHEKDNNLILQDEIIKNFDLWELEESKILFEEHDIRILTTVILLHNLLSFQKMKLFLPGQLDTMDVQKDYVRSLGETKQQIIILMGELDVPIQEEDIIFTNRLK